MNKNNSDYKLETMLKNYCARKSQIAFSAPLEDKRMTKKKSLRYAATAFALAAVMAAGVFSGFVFNRGAAPQTNNGFVVTAYAAEATSDEAEQIINDESFIRIGKIEPKMIIQGSLMQDVSGTTPNIVGMLQNFNVRCEGENIDKITYKAENGNFFIDGNDKAFFDKKAAKAGSLYPVTEGDKIYWHLSAETAADEFSEKQYYSEFSVSYSDQELIQEKDGSIFTRIGLLTQFYNDTDSVMSDREMYESAINKLVISVNVTYKDGTTETQRIRLKGNYDEDYGITVTAKLAD